MKLFRSLINPFQILFLFKVGFGSAISILLADSLGLLYSPSAGIITLLTIQNTKKETISIALRRIVAFLLAVSTSFLVFSSLGYTSTAFGVFLLIFVGLCMVHDLKDGISMNAVLMTHFLIEKEMTFSLIGNEMLLLLIGMGIGILLNMIMPNTKARIRREQIVLEEEMKRSIRGLANSLKEKNSCLLQPFGREKSETSNDITGAERTETGRTEAVLSGADRTGEEFIDAGLTRSDLAETERTEAALTGADRAGIELIDAGQTGADRIRDMVDFKRLEEMLDGLLKKAYEDAGNTLLNNTRYLVSYLEMRKLQVDVLKSIAEHIGRIPVVLRQSLPIVDFLEHTAASFHELNNVVSLLEELERLNLHYKNEALPQTREEFEYRATLYQILKELEYFLLLKRNFVLELEEKDMKSYWNR